MKSKWMKKLATYGLVFVLSAANRGDVQASTTANEEVIETTQVEEIVELQQEENTGDSTLESGTEESFYMIYDAIDLLKMNEDLSGSYKLANDINLDGQEWTPVGTYKKPFKGHLDGNGFTISNFTIDSNESFVGFFGYLRNAEIARVSLEDFQVNGVRYVGGLAGCAQGAQTVIEDCHLPSGSVSGTNDIGGLIGYGNSITITECTSNAVVNSVDSTMDSNIGGILGYNYRTAVKKCYYAGTVNSIGANAGGLAGLSYVGSYEECYSDGKVVGVNYVGGLVGNFGTVGTIFNCFALGEVSGNKYVGGISGYKGELTNCYFAGIINGAETVYGVGYNASVTNCYFDTTINTIATAPSLARTTAEMFQKETYTDWDFENVWKIVEGSSYPYLEGLPIPNATLAKVSIVTMSGSIINGKTGGAIAGATAKVSYVNYKGETVLFDTVITNASGVFTIEHAVLGETYTIELTADGYVSKTVTVICTGVVIDVGTIVVIPTTSPDVMTVILTWGENPSDLDTHFLGNNCHVYFGAKTANGVVLDLDDTLSYGPETLTINTSTLPVGTYSYIVLWYSGSGTWGTSNANVEVYLGNEHINTFRIADTETSSGGQWNAFNIVIEDNPNSVSSTDKHTVRVVYSGLF